MHDPSFPGSMAGRYEGKHVVVTGGSSGIGRALGVAFGREGATVWLGARTQDALESAAREVDASGGAGRAVALDVRSEESVAAFAQAVARETKGVSVLINNAGVGGPGRVEDVSLEKWRRIIDTNLTGPFLVTKAFLPMLRAAEGRRHVVNVVSVSGKQAFAGGGTYSASKFGLRGWTEALASELAEEGIRVTAILPGYVATKMVRGVADEGRMIQPDDLARTVVDLTLAPDSLFMDEVVVWPWRMYTE